MTSIAQQLRAIADQIEMGVVDNSDGNSDGMIHPGPDGLAIVDGIALYIDEPIRADWKMGLARVPLAADRRTGVEPSNAFDSGLPKRSPAGYPMMYGVGPNGPMAPGRVMYDGSTFADDAEIEVYKKRVAQRAENLAEDERRRVAQVFKGPVPVGSLTDNDLAYLWSVQPIYRGVKHNGDLFYELLAGTFLEIANAKRRADNVNPSMGVVLPDNGSLPGLVNDLVGRAKRGR